MSLHLQACSSLRDYGRLWCCGFSYLGLLGSAAFEATVVNFVSFCFCYAWVAPPPGSSFWWSWVVARLPLGLCSSGLNFGLRSSVFWWVSFWVARPVPSPARQGLMPLGFLPFLVFCVSLLWLCALRRTVSLDVSQLAGSNTYIHT